MTYHYLKCPHCHKSLGRITGTPNRIGDPFRRCPWCGGIYIDAFTREWITKSPFQRFMFFFSTPFMVTFLFFIFFSGMIAVCVGSGKGRVALIIILCVSSLLSIGLFVFLFVVRKKSFQETIRQSLERTKRESYVKLLQQARLKIYPIKGIEIGTIKDTEDTNKQEENDVRSEIHTTFTHP